VSNKIRGPLIREIYENGKLIERRLDKRGFLSADHWRKLRDSHQLFCNPYLRTSFDYRLGGEVMDYYSATNKALNRKYIYRNAFNTRPRLKK